MRKIFSVFLISLLSCSMLFSQGNVGIGTTTPNKGILDIVGNTTFSNLSVSNATGTLGMSLNYSELGFNMYRAAGVKQFANGYSGAINFSAGKMKFFVSNSSVIAGDNPADLFSGTAAIAIDSNRNVGIGSDFPSNFPGSGLGSKLLIAKVANNVNDPHLMLYSGTNLGDGVASLHFRVGGFGTPPRTWRLEGINASSLANERFNITNSAGGTIVSVAGNNRVAIGSPSTFATGYMLSVRGKIMCEELRVQLNAAWPDYVFEPEYKRLSLTDLEAIVKLQKHLPGIPSAAEMAKENGILVGDFQQKLLEKMEELYLYVFELNNENKALRKQVEVLTTKVGE
jgi:hypothetical protein